MRRNSAGIVSKSNRQRRQRLIEAIEPRILMSTSWTVSDVADFNGTNGENPIAGVYRDSGGNLWGTTYNGGANSYGTIYKVAAGTNIVTTILNFNATNGSGPWGDMIADSSGNIYGTTAGGGASSDGTVYKITAGTNTVTTVASFNGTDGANPGDGLFLDSNGNLWGTTENGGANNDGAVFKIAAGTSTISLVASFSSATGVYPLGGLVVDSSGNVYGTIKTSSGGVGGGVFEIPSGSSSINVLASFTSNSGYQPLAGVVRDSSGNLYGTTYSGGANGDGTVFELASGANTITPLASFNGTNGAQPKDALLIDSSGNLYGTTQGGGASNDGTAFELVHGSGTITTLASFNGTNGQQPQAKLTMDSNGNLYGTTWDGGASSDGNVFELTPHTSSKLAFTSGPTSTTAGTSQSISVSVEDAGGTTVTTDTSTVTLSVASGPSGGTIVGTTSVAAVNGVATFSGLTFSTPGAYTLTATASNLTSATSNSFTIVQNYSDAKLADLSNSLGKYPEELVMDSSGNMYGVTNQGGGSGNDGAVYKIAAGTHAVTLLASFSAPSATSGAFPQSGLTLDSSGNLWGTTSQGGTNSAGVIYKIANGSSTITTVASLPRVGNNITAIDDNLAIDSSGDLFGASQEGSDGFVFELPANSSSVSIVHSFSGSDGANPVGSVIVGPNGILYGTTTGGGSDSDGTVYQISNGTLTTLATFNGSGNGSGPEGTPVRDSNGDLFGTTNASGAHGDGTVWEIPAGGTLTTLAAFNNTDGAAPQRGQLILDSAGNLYGTTYSGGSSSDGTAWELPAGTGTIVTLANFTNATGYNPPVGLLMDSNGNLFGATTSGAANTYGSVFELTPSATQAVFSTAPTSVTTDAPQSITVNLEDAGGQTDVSNTSTVTLSIASGPAGATLGGTTSVSAVNGVATFSGVTFSTVGTYTLTASSSGLASGTSSSIVFSPSLDVWSGSGDNQTWSSGANWQGGYAPVSGQSVDFPNTGSNQTTINLGQNVTVGDLTVAGFDVFPNYTITVDGNLASDSTNPNVGINSEVVLTHNTTVMVSAGDYLNLRSPSNGGNGYGITKEGAGYLELYGSSEPGLAAEAALGTLEVDNTTIGTVTVDSGATLQGNGIINGITDDGGTVRPSGNFSNATTLTSSGPVSLGSGSTFDELITQGMSGSPDGKLLATGSAVNLTGSSLVVAVQNGFTPTIGNVITVISNQTGSAVTGTFSGLAEGTIFRSGNSFFQISYVGGSSQQDVTLTVVAAPVDVWTGTAGDGVWATAGNWSYGTPATGQSVDFPDINGSTTDDVTLANAVTVGNITMEGNYAFSGSSITINGDITASNTSDTFADVTNLTHDTTVNVGVGDNLVYGGGVLGDNGNNYGVTLTGGGTLIFTYQDIAAYTGSTVVQDGTLDNESEVASTITVDAGGTVQGNGQFDSGIVGNGGTLSLGNSSTVFTTMSVPSATFANGTTLHEELGNNGAEVDGELTVGGGTINLTGSNLTLSTDNGFTPSLGDDITLISNQTGSAVTGTFNGLDEGTAFQAGGSWFRISYAGGSSQKDVTLTVIPAPATQAVFTGQPVSVTAGTAQSIAVSLESGSGAVDTTNTSTVTLSIASGPAGATIGGTLTESAVAGVASFAGLTFTKAGTYTLTASSNGLTSATSGTITVNAAAPNHLLISQQPTGATAGQSIGTVAVEVVDFYGNRVTTDNSTVSLATSTAISGTGSVGASGGVATFTGLSIDHAGNYTLSATDGSLTSAATQFITIAPSAATHLVIAQQPTSTSAGQTFGTVVDVEDAYGNVVTNDNSTITLVPAGTGALHGNLTAQAVDGVATFTGLSIDQAGDAAFSATDGQLASASTNPIATSTATASRLVITTEPANTANTGKSIGTIAVAIEDAYGNIVTGNNSTVTLSGASSLTGTATAPAHNGVATFSNLAINSPGTFTLTASDGNLTPASAEPIKIATANVAIAGHTVAPIAINTQTVLPQSTAKTLTVKVESQSANGATVMTKKISVKNGMAMISNLTLHQAGDYTLVISDAQGHTTTQQLTVLPAVATRLAFVTQPKTVDGSEVVTVQVLDQYDNSCNTASGTMVTLHLGPYPVLGPNPKLTGDLTAEVIDGVATFRDVAVHHSGQGRLWAFAPGLADARSNIFTNIQS